MTWQFRDRVDALFGVQLGTDINRAPPPTARGRSADPARPN